MGLGRWDLAVGLDGTWWDIVGLGSGILWWDLVGLGSGTWWDLFGGTWQWDLVRLGGTRWDLVGGT